MPSQVDIRDALAHLPGGVFAITSAYDGRRSGCLVKSVQACADEPVLVSVAVRKGHEVETLIRDSRHFGVCQIDPSDKLALHALSTSGDHEPEIRHDPFDSLAVYSLVSGSPMLRRALLCLDCEVVRHFDMEADHELYIGMVLAARVASSHGEDASSAA